MRRDIQYTFRVDESDIDLLISEEFACNQAFRTWFISKISYQPSSYVSTLSLGRSISNHHGESDIQIVYQSSDGVRHAILIENKISAPPTIKQAERYRSRGNLGKSDGKWDSFYTVLIAPNKYLTNSSMNFDYRISYEDICSFLDGEGEPRAKFKCHLINAAVKKGKSPRVANPDAELTSWFVDARNFGISEFPDLPLPEEKRERSPTNKWISFKLPSFPMSRVGIEVKPHNGHTDLRFNRVDLGEMRRAFAGRLPAGSDTVLAKQSCAIRMVRPKASVELPFETQRDLVRPMMDDASTLLHFAATERGVIMRLLDYEE